MQASPSCRRRWSPACDRATRRRSRLCSTRQPSAACFPARCTKGCGRTSEPRHAWPSSNPCLLPALMRPADDSSTYRARRERLAAAMGAGVAVVPTAPERIRNRDTHYPYRFDSHFYYLTGFPEPEAALVVVAGESPRSLLFCRERNEEREIWDGFRHGPQAARERFGFDEAHPIE